MSCMQVSEAELALIHDNDISAVVKVSNNEYKN